MIILGDDSDILSLSSFRNPVQTVTRTVVDTVIVTDIHASIVIEDPVADVVVVLDDVDGAVATVVVDEDSIYAGVDVDDVMTVNTVDEEDIVIHAVVEVIE